MPLGVDQQAFRPRELHLHRPLREIGDEGGVMLYRYVLLAAEAAAYQTVADLYLFRRQAQHPHDLMLGIVSPLIRRENHDPISIRIRHRALRLQKGVLRPRGAEAPGQQVSGFCQRLCRVSPLDMLMGQQVAVPMHQRRIRQHGLLRAVDGRQLLIVHLHQRLGLRQNFRRLRSHQTDGIPQIVGNVSHGDHGIPVFFQVAHLIVSRNVRRRQHADHAG